MHGYVVTDRFNHEVFQNPISKKWTLGRFLFHHDEKELAKALRDLMNNVQPGCPYSGIVKPFKIQKVK